MSNYVPRIEFVVDTTPDYSIGDQIGDPVEITNAALTSGGGGILLHASIMLHAAQFVPIELFFFKDNPSSANDDNATIDISDADVENALFSIYIPDGRLQAPSSSDYIGTVSLGYSYQCTNTSLWVVAKAAATVNFAATDDLQLVLGLLRD